MTPSAFRSRFNILAFALGTALAGAQDYTSDPAGEPSANTIITEREEVETLEDGSVAEAIDRRPDLSFSNVTLDGENAGISLSDLDSEAVSSVEVLRAVTPEMDADARGGSLSLRSNPAFKLTEPSTTSTWELRHHAASNRNRNEFSINHARPLGNVGLRLNAGIETVQWGDARYSADWRKLDASGPIELKRVSVSNRLIEGSEWSMGGAVDWRISEAFYLYLRGDYSSEDEDFYRPNLSFRWDATEDPANPSADTGRVDRDLLAFESNSREYSATFGGYYDGDRWAADFRLVHKDNSYLEPDFFIIEFSRPESDLRHVFDASYHVQLAGMAAFDDPHEFRFEDSSELFSERWDSRRKEWVGAFNLRRQTQLLGGETTFKGGAKWRRRESQQISATKVYSDFDGDFRLSDVVGTYRADKLIGGRYPHGPFPSLKASRAFLAEHRDRFFFDPGRSREESDPSTWDISETVPSIYGMIDWEFGRLRVLSGLRREETQLDYSANEVVMDDAGNYLETNQLEASSGYTNYFPGLHLRYFLSERTTLISSWTRTIKRGNYRDIVPYRNINYENRSIEEGNPGLRPTLYSNFDLAVDFKVSDGTLFALDLAYREASDEVFREEVHLTAGRFAGFTRERLSNGPSATIYSAKVTWRQDLGKLWSPLKGLSSNLNATIQDSETEYPERPGEYLEVVNRPELNLQAMVNYQHGSHFLQLLYEIRGQSLQSVSDLAWRDRYMGSVHDLTIHFSYVLTKNWRLLGEIENLLDQKTMNFFSDPSYLVTHSRASRRFTFTLRWDH